MRDGCRRMRGRTYSPLYLVPLVESKGQGKKLLTPPPAWVGYHPYLVVYR